MSWAGDLFQVFSEEQAKPPCIEGHAQGHAAESQGWEFFIIHSFPLLCLLTRKSLLKPVGLSWG